MPKEANISQKTILISVGIIAAAIVVSAFILSGSRQTSQPNTTTTTQTIIQTLSNQTLCESGGIVLTNVKFCNNWISGQIYNNGSIALGDITFTIFYTNASRELFYTYNYGSGVLIKTLTCCDKLGIIPGQKLSFTFPIGGSNYDIVQVTTNCTTVRVADEYSKDEIVKGC
jgi:hypothetical protein